MLHKMVLPSNSVLARAMMASWCFEKKMTPRILALETRGKVIAVRRS